MSSYSQLFVVGFYALCLRVLAQIETAFYALGARTKKEAKEWRALAQTPFAFIFCKLPAYKI